MCRNESHAQRGARHHEDRPQEHTPPTVSVAVVTEDDATEGPRVSAQIDRMATKYLGTNDGYALRDPSKHERRVLFEFTVDSVATFGRP